MSGSFRLFIVPSWYPTAENPGAGSFFREQAEALAARGNRVAVLYAEARFRRSGPAGFFERTDGSVPVLARRGKNPIPGFEPGLRLTRGRMLEKLYREAEHRFGRPDLVHLHSCRQAFEAAALCRRHSLPLVWTEHYSGLMRDPGRALRAECLCALENASVRVAVSAALRDSMLSLAGSSFRETVEVVPNLVDTAVFTPEGPAARPAGGFVFAAMGNFVPVKGFDILLRAFARVKRARADAVLLLAGSGPEEAALRRLAGTLGVGGAVIFTGRVPRADAPRFFRSCDCFICPGRTETFGMVLVEALACGKPVVAADCGGPRDIVTPQNGLLCLPEDDEALAGAMLSLCADVKKYPAPALRQSCSARFSAEAVCSRLEELYARAVAGRNPLKGTRR